MTNIDQANSLGEHLTKADVCEHLGVSERALENLVARGEFPPGVRIGKRVYWSRKAFQRWRERAFSAQEEWVPSF